MSETGLLRICHRETDCLAERGKSMKFGKLLIHAVKNAIKTNNKD